MNEVQRRMGKLRGWNLTLLILASISLIVNVVSLPGTLFPKKSPVSLLQKKTPKQFLKQPTPQLIKLWLLFMFF